MKNDMYAIMKNGFLDITIGSWLHRVSEFYPDQDALVNVDRGVRLSWKQLDRRAVEVAKGLHAMGIRRGDKVAIWATNYPEWLYLLFGCSKIGAILVTVNTNYKIFELEYLLRQSDTKALFYIHGVKGSDYTPIVKPLLPEIDAAGTSVGLHSDKLPFLEDVVYIPYDANDPAPEHLFTWQNMIDGGAAIEDSVIEAISAQLSPHDVINMQYTSGTTGFPKGVMLTHRNVVNNGKCIGDRMDLSTADRMMIQVPMFHCFGMVLAMTAAMTHSAMLSPLPYFSPKPALTCINQERITCFHGVPTMFIAMLQHKDFNSVDFSHMRTGIMAGSPCPISVMQDVQEKMNMKEITIVYGQTEASPGCTMSSTDDPIDVRVSTVGRPLPEIECKVVDPETGLEMPDGENGEFIARGYNIMKGYYKMPGATAAAIDEKGWLHTGDLACRTPEGNFRITGRLKDMIIRGGENIYPKEIEEFLYTYPKVEDVQVIGVPDPGYGEEIMACIILKKGETATEEEIKDYVRQNMAKHKIPRYISFTDSFPMNAAGKILKYKMREDAIKELNLEVKK